MAKIGYACITLTENHNPATRFTLRRTTVAWCERQSQTDVTRKITDLVDHNCTSLERLVDHLAGMPPVYRMFRIGSDFLPLATHSVTSHLYSDKSFRKHIADRLSAIGQKARDASVRLSFHPSQFVVLNSSKQKTITRSMREIEYHTFVANAMGFYGKGHDDFVINVHIGARQDSLRKFIASWATANEGLSDAAKKLLTIENCEFIGSSQAVLALCNHYGFRMVFDLHHHWVKSGVFIKDADTKLLHDIRDTWEGFTPKVHISCPTQDKVKSKKAKPVFSLSAARSHADVIWHPQFIKSAGTFHRDGWDIMVEAKAKNRASYQLIRKLNIAKKDT